MFRPGRASVLSFASPKKVAKEKATLCPEGTSFGRATAPLRGVPCAVLLGAGEGGGRRVPWIGMLEFKPPLYGAMP